MRRLSGAHMICASLARLLVTRAASPPSRADAAKISPRATNATLRPSGESARLWNPVVERQVFRHRPDRRAAAADRHLLPRGRESTSSDQIEKSRSKTIVRPSAEMSGQSTRPARNCVTCFGWPESGCVQMFSAPLRSDMKKRLRPSPLHIGQ